MLSRRRSRHGDLWTPTETPINGMLELVALFRPEDSGNALVYRTLAGKAIVIDFGVDPKKKASRQKWGTFTDNTIRPVPPPPEARPHINWLREHRHEIQAVLLTHGHLDHTGGISYFPFKTKVFGSLVTKKLATKQAETWGRRTPYFTFITKDFNRFALGPFIIQAFPVPHSVPQAKAFVIDVRTKNSTFRAMHLGEFKFYGMTEDTKPKLERLLRKYAKERPIDLLVIDAIRADIKGFTPPKGGVVRQLNRIIEATPRGKRIVVSFFASDFDFLQEIFRLTNRLDKTVKLYGRSMKDNYQIGKEIGWWRDATPTLVANGEDIAIATGNQGEKRSALERAGDEEGTLSIGPTDVVINFARPIPGNERQFLDAVSRLVGLGATLYLDDRISLPREIDEKVRKMRLHVSGHGAQGDIAHAVRLTRPRYVVPLHPNAEGTEFFRRLSRRYNFKLVLLG